MKFRWTVLLIIINALLIWAVLDQVVYAPSERAFNDQVRTFLPLTKTDWDGMGVTTSTGSWKVSRDKWGRWWLRAPYEWPAKTSLISRMNGTLATLPVDSAFAAADLGRVGQSLHSYGLDNPRAVLEVSTGSKTLSYKIGNATPLGNKVYILSADEKEVWVVDASINEYLGYTATQIKQEGFFPFSLIELESVDVEQKGITTRFERKQGTNNWQLKLDDRTLALKPGAWEGWLEKLSSSPTGEPSATDANQQTIGSSTARIVFQTLYGRRSLILGDLDKTGERRWVQWEGAREAFYMPVGALSVLQPESLLETRPLSLDPGEISTLDWSTQNPQGTLGVLSLRKLEGGQWVLSPQNAVADLDAVHELLEKLCSAEANPILKAEPAPATATEKIRVQAGGQNIELLVNRQANVVELWSAGARVIYRTDSWPLLPPLQDISDRRLFESSVGELTEFSFKRMTDGKISHFAATQGQAQPQFEALRALLKNNAKVKRWVEPVPTDLGAVQYQMEVALGDKHLIVELWHTPKGWLGRSLTNGRTFEPDDVFAGLLDTLTTL